MPSARPERDGDDHDELDERAPRATSAWSATEPYDLSSAGASASSAGASPADASSAALGRRRPGRPRRGLGGLDGLGLRLGVVGDDALGVDGLRRGGGLGLELRDRVVQQARLDRLLRADVAALAHAGALADAVAQVVELRAAHVAAGGDLDLLDLRRVHRERALARRRRTTACGR